MSKSRMLWAWQGVFTQTTSTGTVTIRMTVQEKCTFLWGQIGLDNYGAGRAFTFRLHDVADGFIANLEAEAAIDNHLFVFPVSDHSVASTGDGPYFFNNIEMGKGDYIEIVGTSLLATETITLAYRAEIKTTKPVVSASTSAGTIPVVVSQDKVI